MAQYNILLVEDDESLAEVLIDCLEMNDYHVVHASDGLKALAAYRSHRPDLILLDVVLPEKDGYEVAKVIRKKDIYTPILFMTGTEVETKDRLKAYEIGACDYLIKPLVPEELLAKLKVWRATRRIAGDQDKPYKIGKKRFILSSSTLKRCDDIVIALSNRQRLLLEHLLDCFGQQVTKQDLMYTVWKNDHPNNEQMLRNQVSSLRKKLQDLSLDIAYEYGTGYTLIQSS